jgi:peptidoglycan/xylan/chitin deacetylase (PgdA/CDA1 family)
MFQLKRLIRKIIYGTTSWEPFLRSLRKIKVSQKIVVLMYHEIADDKDDIEAWTVVKKSDFIKQMEYLRNSFNVISLGEGIELMETSSDTKEPSAIVTFDDGYSGNARILLPILKSMDIPTTIFISTKAVQNQEVYWYDKLINAFQSEKDIEINLNYLSLRNYRINRCRGARNWMEIQSLLTDLKKLEPSSRDKIVKDITRDLNNTSHKKAPYNITPLTIHDLYELAGCSLITIGAHSHDHEILPRLSEDEARVSIQKSRELLESWSDRRVYYFSYPNGDYSDNVIKILKENGFQCSLTTMSGLWEKGDSLFKIPRLGIGRYDSLENFKVRVSGVIR